MSSPLPTGEPARPRVSVVVPCHDEEESLPRVLASLIPALAGADATQSYEVVIVDDNSSDGTPGLADAAAAGNPRIRVVHRTSEPGFGHAMRAGMAAATGDAIVPFMGDLSDDPQDIPRMLKKLDEGWDVVYGSRFVPGGALHGYPRGKMLANRSFNNAVRLMFGIKVHDISNAFKMYRREVLDAIGLANLQSDQFDLTIELPLRAHILGFRSTEIPVTWTNRDAGVAKFRVGRMGRRYGKRLLQLFVLGNLLAVRDLVADLWRGPAWQLVAGGVLGILLLLGVAQFAGATDNLDRLGSASLLSLGGAMLVSWGALMIRTWRWSVLLRTAEHRVEQTSAYRCIMFGWFLNYLLPFKLGDVARGVSLRTIEPVPVGASLATIAIERILDLLVLAAFLALGVFFYVEQQATIQQIALLGGAVVGVLALGTLVVAFYTGFLQRPFPRLHKVAQASRDAVRLVAANPAALLLSVLLSVAVWTLEISTVFFSARAFGLDLPLHQVALVGAAAFLAQALPATPAGLGLHEGAIASVLVLFGVDGTTGFLVGLADHLARGVIVYVLGAIATVHLGFQSRQFFRQRRLERGRVA